MVEKDKEQNGYTFRIDEKDWRVRYIKLALMMQTCDVYVAVL